MSSFAILVNIFVKLPGASLGKETRDWNGEKSTFNFRKGSRGLTIAGSSFSSPTKSLTSANHTIDCDYRTRAPAKVRGELRNLVRASLTFARKTRNQLAVWLVRARSNPGSGQTRFALRLREAECAASTMNQAPHFIPSRPSRRTGCPTVSCLSSVALLFLLSWKIIITNVGCRDGLLERRH